MERYNPKHIEAKWRKTWADTELYKTDPQPGDDKYYCLVMFPYPSGNLHVGHWYNFGPADVVARYHRMKGKKVLHPIGFDAFGLPAENAAIKHEIPPATWTRSNIESMLEQIDSIGTMYDLDKLVNTSSPEFYKWTQWLFLKLYENGLAYKQKGLQNWCPKDQTVLANEQVVGENNECERCGTPVEKKELEQWFFKITDYAEELLTGLEGIDWPGRVKTMQENWIGKSTGAKVTFEIANHEESFDVFTTRHDTQFGVTFVVISPEHELLTNITSPEQQAAVDAYVKQAALKTNLDRQIDDKNKTGVFTGAYAINPVNNEKVPIWVADYVLMGYGTGIVMGVPGHDERDKAFAEKFDIEIRKVYKTDTDTDYHTEGEVINSGDYDGLSTQDARERILADMVVDGVASEQVNYRLRDWLISRQRYWGCPIPIIYCDDCGTVPVPEDQLPVVLPEDVAFKPTGQSPLVDDDSFVDTTCPSCSKPAKRETDTMDTFVDSSWYFLRYPNTDYDGMFDPEAVAQWMPVDHYIGGVEHAILHLLYARFITKALRDHAGLPFDEPFKKLSNQGIILGPDGLKMSKSKGNVVNPDEQVASYGTDSLRLYMMFMGPYDQGGPYDLGGIAGQRRFLDRVWSLVSEHQAAYTSQAAVDDNATRSTELLVATHKMVKKVTADLEKLGFNTAIAAMMELVNAMNKIKADLPVGTPAWHEAIEMLLRVLAPFAPHMTEELWHALDNSMSIHLEPWPAWDPELLVESTQNIVVQVNGKVRANILVAADATKDELIAAAQADEKVKTHLGDGPVKKSIVVPGRLVNFVV